MQSIAGYSISYIHKISRLQIMHTTNCRNSTGCMSFYSSFLVYNRLSTFISVCCALLQKWVSDEELISLKNKTRQRWFIRWVIPPPSYVSGDIAMETRHPSGPWVLSFLWLELKEREREKYAHKQAWFDSQ